MPRNRFALSVRVGRQDQTVSRLGKIGNRLELLGLVGVVFPLHRKAIVRVNRTVFGRQIADVAVGREDAEVLAQIAFNGFGFGR